MIIWCFVNTEWTNGAVMVAAIANDGTFLAEHFSSNRAWGKHDIGIGSQFHHNDYLEAYPDGCELRWIEDFASDDNPPDFLEWRDMMKKRKESV